MAKLTPLDFAFLALETFDSPMHVAGLQVFELPPGTGDKQKFVQDLFTALMAHTQCTPPLNRKLQAPMVGMPEWVEDNNIELAYHVRHSVLPSPGSREQLYELVSRLHANLLDRSRPLWEFHLISGMEGERFALYTKLHHAFTDGITAVGMMQRALNESPDDKTVTPIWGLPARERTQPTTTPKGFLEELLGTARILRQQAGTATDLGKIALKLSTQALGLSRDQLPIPFTAPKTALNAPVFKARAFSSVQFPLDRAKRVSKAADVSLNDVMLTICDMGIQWYLRERGTPTQEPMVCQVPVSVRREGESGGNKVAMALVRLGDSDSEPRKRLREISRSAADFKEIYGVMEPDSLITYTLLVQGFAQMAESLKITDYVPPVGNMLLSNVPGPRETLYLNGAPLVELYPVNVVPPGLSYNVTVLSYAGTMFMGVIAGRSATPELTRMTDHIWDAFETLEKAVVGTSE
jgi:WS/DGAT/MGAT family acyltransferase